MAKNNFLDWSTTASSNTDIGGIGILGTNAVNNFDDAFRTSMAQLRSGVDGKAVYATKNGNYTALENDNNAVHRYTATATLSLTAAATLGVNWHYTVVADGGSVTIDPNGSETINSRSSLVVPNGTSATIICSGTAFFTVVRSSAWESIDGGGSFSGLSSVTFTNLSAFDIIRISMRITPSVAGSIVMRTSSNNGSSYDTGASDYFNQNWTMQGAGAAASSSSASLINLTGFSVDAGTQTYIEHQVGFFNQPNPSRGLSRSFGVSAGALIFGTVGSARTQTTARDAFSIFPGGGGTISGNIIVEGRR